MLASIVSARSKGPTGSAARPPAVHHQPSRRSWMRTVVASDPAPALSGPTRSS